MKLIRTKNIVLASAQTGRTNIVAAKMESFTLLDDKTAFVEVGYSELVENKNGEIGDQLYRSIPLNVTGSLPNKPSVKRIPLTAAKAAQIWGAIGGQINQNVDLLKTMSDLFTTATLVQLVFDGNFVKIENGTFIPLGMQDWEIVDQPNIISQGDIDRWILEAQN